jgi:Zn-dependent protease
MTQAGVLINLVMLAFNLFPVPPLDGGRILVSVLPYKYAYRFAQIEPYGFFIVMGLVMLNVLQVWLVPVINIALLLVQIITSPLSILLGQ